MKSVLVDTCIWSEAFRKKGSLETRSKLADIVNNGQAQMLGAVRQELLSGLSDQVKFEKLRQRLWAFKDIEIITEDYEVAARFSNQCRVNGIQGSNIDFLICAAAYHRDYDIYTADQDFFRFQQHIPINIYQG